MRVVDDIPRTTWYRVRTDTLRAEGIPADEDVWVLAADRQSYRRRKAKPAKTPNSTK